VLCQMRCEKCCRYSDGREKCVVGLMGIENCYGGSDGLRKQWVMPHRVREMLWLFRWRVKISVLE
jgi:hypothetical protein